MFAILAIKINMDVIYNVKELFNNSHTLIDTLNWGFL